MREINTHTCMYDANLLHVCATIVYAFMVHVLVFDFVYSTRTGCTFNNVRLQITDMLFLSTTYEYECRWGILQGYFHKIEG